MRWIGFVALLALIGCGVDGPPEPVGERKGGLTVSGTATAGVSGSL